MFWGIALATLLPNLVHGINVPDQGGVANGDIRLVGGDQSMEGRVEIFLNGSWGTVCDDQWDVLDAQVVCRQLGYGTEQAQFFGRSRFGRGSDNSRIWLHNVGCTGQEFQLISCPVNGVSVHLCDHSQDAGVSCGSPPAHAGRATGDIRLVGGAHSREGRVEIYLNGSWGTVCDDQWDVLDAQVVCRQLGYGTVLAQSFMGDRFGGATDLSTSIWLDEVQCIGSEPRLIDCQTGSKRHNCLHEEDAGVSCGLPAAGGTGSKLKRGDVRLTGGSHAWEGRVEIFLNGTWGTICDNMWLPEAANVVCRQLGYSRTIKAQSFVAAHFGQARADVPVWLDYMLCAGNEARLMDCMGGEFVGNHLCSHAQDAGVTCNFASGSSTIRLVDGLNANSGRVEVFVHGEWGTICDDGWNHADAVVVCRQLGYNTTFVIAHEMAMFGEGAGRIHFHQVKCLGHESSIWECPATAAGEDVLCVHGEDAGVTCGVADDTDPVTIPYYTPKPSNDYRTHAYILHYTAALFSATNAAVIVVVIIVLLVCMRCCKAKEVPSPSPSANPLCDAATQQQRQSVHISLSADNVYAEPDRATQQPTSSPYAPDAVSGPMAMWQPMEKGELRELSELREVTDLSDIAVCDPAQVVVAYHAGSQKE